MAVSVKFVNKLMVNREKAIKKPEKYTTRFTPYLTQSQLDKGSAIIEPNPVQSIKSPKEASSRLKARLT